MSLKFAALGSPAEKINMSPLVGIPTKPQLALSLQFEVVPLSPDQLSVAASPRKGSNIPAKAATNDGIEVPRQAGNDGSSRLNIDNPGFGLPATEYPQIHHDGLFSRKVCL